MLRAALTFFVLAILSYVLGAYSIAGVSMEIGRMLLWAFLLLAVLTGIVSLVSGRTPRNLP